MEVLVVRRGRGPGQYKSACSVTLFTGVPHRRQVGGRSLRRGARVLAAGCEGRGSSVGRKDDRPRGVGHERHRAGGQGDDGPRPRERAQVSGESSFPMADLRRSSGSFSFSERPFLGVNALRRERTRRRKNDAGPAVWSCAGGLISSGFRNGRGVAVLWVLRDRTCRCEESGWLHNGESNAPSETKSGISKQLRPVGALLGFFCVGSSSKWRGEWLCFSL